MMRKLSIFLVVAIFLMTLVPGFVSANVGDIYSIDVDVILNDDGSARVTQVWDAQMNANTEIYIPMTNMEDMAILNLQVSDSTGAVYETLSEWDVDASLEEKANKAGLNPIDDGVEICWGIGDYTRKTYTVTYDMTNLVKGYSDYDGFNSRFINNNMNPLPQATSVTIGIADRPLTADEVGMWAFGYDGDINLVDGKVVAKTINGIRSEREHMTIMLRLADGILNPRSSINAPFTTLSDVAFEGSSYSDADRQSANPKSADLNDVVSQTDDSTDTIPIGAIFAALTGIVVAGGAIAFGSSLSKVTDISLPSNLKDLPKESHVQYSSKVPLEGYIPAIVYAMQGWGNVNQGDILNAYMLKWARDGLLRIDEKDLGGEDSRRDDFRFYLSDAPAGIKDEELELYTILKTMERPEGYINKSSMEAFIENDSVTWNGHFENLIRIGKKYFKDHDYIRDEVVSGFMGKEKEVEIYTDKGFEVMENVYGFKKFLKDLPTNYKEYGTDNMFAYDANSWDEYVMYAGLIGGDSKFGMKLGNLNDKYNSESEYGRGYSYGFPGYYPYYLFNSLNSVRSNVNSSSSSPSFGGGFSGGGGSASFGGGGGFSGGGGGGGSR